MVMGRSRQDGNSEILAPSENTYILTALQLVITSGNVGDHPRAPSFQPLLS